MSSTFSHTSSFTKIVLLTAFFLVTYLVYSLTKHVYNSYKIDQYIDTFKSENVMLEEEIDRKNEDYLYFTSEEYIDKIAKQSMNLVNPGEEVIILSDDVLSDDTSFIDEDLPEFATYRGLSVSEQWWRFFFGS